MAKKLHGVSNLLFICSLLLVYTERIYAQFSQGICKAASPTGRGAPTFDLKLVRAWAKHPVPPNATPNNSTATDYVIVISHRGEWRDCPENTLESYNLALDSGVDGVEMDIRISAPGYDPTTGTRYTIGEAFLTHDFDLIGEAPDPSPSGDGHTVIYTATPDQIEGRSMVDRHDNPALDSNNNPILFHSLTDILTNSLARLKSTDTTYPGKYISAGTGRNGFDQVIGGWLLTLDIKGDDWPNYKLGTPDPHTANLLALQESMAEVKTFEDLNKVDLALMLIYKIKASKVKGVDWNQLITKIYPTTPPNYPGLILIVYPTDVTGGRPASVTDLETYPGYFMTNWNVRYDGSPTQALAFGDLLAGKGNSGFASENAFPEGIRTNDGKCCQNQPVLTSSLSSYDYLFQPNPTFLQRTVSSGYSGTNQRVIATLETVDNVSQMLNYLGILGLRNEKRVKLQ